MEGKEQGTFRKGRKRQGLNAHSKRGGGIAKYCRLSLICIFTTNDS